ncbi:MAG TPA: hypothetical protein VL049_20150 [Candidatus Dormibacteraeota bacterium]|nr:hypothetical protein [Candidatus Dormibacteraeota bacterium]
MRWLHGHLARAAAIGALGTCFVAPLSAADEPGDGTEAVIPPGHEELLLAMLGHGAALPDGCTFSDGKVLRTVVRATHTCPLGDVVIELLHPEHAPEAATETERFALIVDSGSPPDSLLDAVAAKVRARESGFEWQRAVEVDAAAVDGDSGERVAPDDPR